MQKHRTLIALLAICASAQFVVLGFRFLKARPEPVSARTLGAGDTVSVLVARTDGGNRIRIALMSERPTVLVAFDSSCGWCDSVAPAWARWMSQKRNYRIIGVTRSSRRSAVRYAQQHMWALDSVLELDSEAQHGLERALTSRTPWLFAVDRFGVLQFDDHGANYLRVVEWAEPHALAELAAR